MTQLLHYSPITHAHIQPVWQPELGCQINGRTTVRYLRFLRPVKIERLELPRHVYGRWEPGVPTHPAHLIISTLSSSAPYTWQVLQEAELAPDPRIWGEGLPRAGHDLTREELNAHFQHALDNQLVPTVNLAGLQTDLLKIECDREHPTWPNHGETNSNRFQVPFGILNTLKVYGQPLGKDPSLPHYQPILEHRRIQPAAPKGMTWRQWGESILFESPFLSIGFALRRPLLLHLGWDALGGGAASANRLSVRRVRFDDANRGVSGPLLVTPWGDYGSHRWTGEVEILGNRVLYRTWVEDVKGNRVMITVRFLVEAEHLVIEMTQQADAELPALESDAWRLAFSLARGMTGIAGAPTEHSGRSGEVHLPALIASDGVGCLGMQVKTGAPQDVHLQVESYRASNEVMAGFTLGERPGGEACQVIPARRIETTIELAVENLQPVLDDKACVKPGPGVLRHWGSTFACYRPEWGGFSNHAASVNCHVNQHGQIEVAAFTQASRAGFNLLEMARFTIQRALLDGSGYGYWRNLYLDSDPVLVSAAGRIYQALPDKTWLQVISPGIQSAVKRMLGTIGADGLAVSRDLSGNSGSYRWSSNACDIVGFGHLDAYVNAWTYRALRTAESLLKTLELTELAQRSRAAADQLKANYAHRLVNPETGWVMSWRSRDGQVHDYASLWINGPACAFGVLEPQIARQALANLESLRDRLGLTSARLGLPFNLLPLHPADHLMTKIMNYQWTEPTFEMFTDGSMSPGAITYYLRALAIHGFNERARAMAADLDAGFADGLFTGGAGGGFGEGNEFLSWEGLACGYEGTFGPTLGALYGVAIEQGWFKPPEPEWWPG